MPDLNRKRQLDSGGIPDWLQEILDYLEEQSQVALGQLGRTAPWQTPFGLNQPPWGIGQQGQPSPSQNLGRFPEGYGPAPAPDEGQMQLVTPNVGQLPDGTYIDMSTMSPLSPELANRLISEYWSSVGPEEGMSELQRAQLDLQRQQFGFQKEQSTAQLALQEKQYAASQLASPRSWIERWYYQNPRGSQRNVGRASSKEEAAKKGLSAFYPTDLQDYGARYISRQGTIAQTTTQEASDKALAGMQAKMAVRGRMLGRELTPEEERGVAREWFEGQMPPRKVRGGEKKPSTPPVPGWLPQFAPGLEGKERLERTDVQTPSLQQWTQTPWSQRQGLAGFVDWVGKEGYQDMLNRMAVMAPRGPARARGFGAARQR